MPDEVQSSAVGVGPWLGASRRAWLLTGGFLAAYLSWQVFRWLPFGATEVADGWFLPLGVAGAVASLLAARRAGGSSSIRSAWRFIGFAWLAYLAGIAVEALYQLRRRPRPIPVGC